MTFAACSPATNDPRHRYGAGAKCSVSLTGPKKAVLDFGIFSAVECYKPLLVIEHSIECAIY